MKLLPLYREERNKLTQELISQCVKGSAKAQRRLFDVFYSDGLNIALRYSSSHEDAKEILSNAFIRVFNKLSKFDTSKAFLPWFKRIIIHANSDYYRYHHSRTISLGELSEPVYEAHILDHLSYQEILGLIQQLSHAHRVVFNLYIIDGYKHREIAELLGISEGTSKSHLSRAKEQLRMKIQDFSKLESIEPVRQKSKKPIIRRS